MSSLPLLAAVSPDVVEIERALTRISYLFGRSRQHERLTARAGVALDRAATTLLRQIDSSEPLRLGELAARLGVEASHVTRQAQQLEKVGYVTRVADPDDRRAQRIQITPAGRDAVDRIRTVSCRGMERALADWTPEELGQFATMFHRLLDDFLASAAEAEEADEARA
jgi:DNA-binding MarR family transcriptional regulator